MKFLSLLCCAFFLTIHTLTVAQNQIDLNELLSRLDQNHMGAVSDVFTPEELKVLKTHLNEVHGISNDANYSGPILEIYGPENQGGDFGFIDANDLAVFNPIGPIGTNDFDGAGAIFPGSDTAHVIDNGGDFFEVDIITGDYILAGSIAPPPGESFTGMEFDTTTGRLYAISSDGTTGTSTLSEIDPVNMMANPIGNTGLMVPIALAIDGSGNAYTYDIDTDFFYLVNLVTAVATSVGFIGFDASFGQGMTYDSVNDRILMTALNNTIVDTELRSVNTTTGATTLIGRVDPGTISQIGWASVNDVPLGITDTAFSGFNFYPNPTGETTNLSALTAIERVEVYTILGQNVLKQDIQATGATLQMGALNPGVYVLKVTINGQVGSYKFIKQ